MPIENVAEDSLSLTSGTPLWASLLLSVMAVLGAHFLTSYREDKKRKLEAIAAWKVKALDLLEQISDDAQAHYTDLDSIEATRLSAQRLLSKLKRFGALMRSVNCEGSDETKRTMDLIADLHMAITGPEEFQNEARAPKPADDPVISSIMDCEERMRANISLPRKPKKLKG